MTALHISYHLKVHNLSISFKVVFFFFFVHRWYLRGVTGFPCLKFISDVSIKRLKWWVWHLGRWDREWIWRRFWSVDHTRWVSLRGNPGTGSVFRLIVVWQFRGTPSQNALDCGWLGVVGVADLSTGWTVGSLEVGELRRSRHSGVKWTRLETREGLTRGTSL